MIVWLIAFLVAVIAGVVSYLFGWWFQQAPK
jgi:membrane protein DedA with SNARE-associated domain